MKYTGLPITDWIQAIGAVVAIVVALTGFFLLFKKDIDKQKQIDSLAEMVLQQSEQTKIMSEQLSIIKRQYLLQSKAQQTRKYDIRPSLWVEPDIICQTMVNSVFSLFNNGGTALIDSIVPVRGNTYKFNVTTKEIGPGAGVTASAVSTQNDNNVLDINIYMRDKDGNNYRQHLHSTTNGVICEIPEEIKHK